MTVADVVSACQARVSSLERRDAALRALVEQYRADGMLYVDAVRRVVGEVRDALHAQGWSDEDIAYRAGVSVGNVRRVCERP